LKLYYRVIAIKTTWYWQKNWCEDQWKRTEDPDINQHSSAHLIFGKGTKNIQWRKGSLFKQMLLGKVAIYLQKTGTRSIPVTLY
jgi:3'-phosphoadenosine 5'-phosphosulfate sulfotransferase